MSEVKWGNLPVDIAAPKILYCYRMMRKYLPPSFYFAAIVFLLASFAVRLPKSAFAAASHIVISEIQISGSSSTDEFVELYNPTSSNIDVAGWKLTKKTEAGTESDLVTFPSKTINAHGYLLLAHTDYDGTPTEDITYSAGSVSTNNTVLLYDSTPTLVDKVGMGTVTDVEGTHTAVPADDASRERKATSTSTSTTMGTDGIEETAGNGEDTNDNSADFIPRTVAQPQNISSATEIPLNPSPSVSPTVSPTTTVSPTLSLTGSVTLTPTLSATPGVTGSVTPSPTASVTPSLTATPSLTPTFTPTETVSVTPTATSTPTITPSVTMTVTPTNTSTSSPTLTSSPSPTNSPTVTMTPTNTPTSTLTPTVTPSATPSSTLTVTSTPSPSATETPTATVTATPTQTNTPTLTMTPTATISVTPSVTPTLTHTPTPTPTGQVFGTFIFPNKTIVCTVDAKVKVRKFFIIFIPVFRCFEV